MQAAKLLVIVMTAALVAGLALLVYGMATRTASLGDGAAPFGNVEVAVPPGASVKAMVADQGRIYLHLATPSGERVLVLDGSSGRRLGEVALLPGAR